MMIRNTIRYIQVTNGEKKKIFSTEAIIILVLFASNKIIISLNYRDQVF